MISILVLSNMYPPHHLGGYELSCQDVVTSWRERGHRVAVLTTTLAVPGAPADDQEADVLRELRFYWDDHVLVSPPPWRRLAIERHNQARLRAALARFQPDVVSVWNMGAMSLGMLTTVHRMEIPMVLVVCDDWLVYGTRLDAWTRLFRDRPRLARVVRRLGGVPTGPPDLDQVGPACFVSEFTRARSRAWSPWSLRRSTVVYSGIDPADFPLVEPAACARGQWRWQLLYVGRLDARKGVETLIRALRLLPEQASLDILGRGPQGYADRLRGLADELGLHDRVRFGVAARDQLYERYRAADTVVFPSEWDEPFGLVPVEAMACGTPVVATGTGGSSEFLLDGINCLLCPPGDPVALAGVIQRLAAEEGLRRAVGEGGLRTASELSVDRLAELLEAWHLAAARRFAEGEPPPRDPPITRPLVGDEGRKSLD